jgi:hypothetical protein
MAWAEWEGDFPFCFSVCCLGRADRNVVKYRFLSLEQPAASFSLGNSLQMTGFVLISV